MNVEELRKQLEDLPGESPVVIGFPERSPLYATSRDYIGSGDKPVVVTLLTEEMALAQNVWFMEVGATPRNLPDSSFGIDVVYEDGEPCCEDTPVTPPPARVSLDCVCGRIAVYTEGVLSITSPDFMNGRTTVTNLCRCDKSTCC